MDRCTVYTSKLTRRLLRVACLGCVCVDRVAVKRMARQLLEIFDRLHCTQHSPYVQCSAGAPHHQPPWIVALHLHLNDFLSLQSSIARFNSSDVSWHVLLMRCSLHWALGVLGSSSKPRDPIRGALLAARRELRWNSRAPCRSIVMSRVWLRGPLPVASDAVTVRHAHTHYLSLIIPVHNLLHAPWLTYQNQVGLWGASRSAPCLGGSIVQHHTSHTGGESLLAIVYPSFNQS